MTTTKKKRLSLCMLIKNDEIHLKACLQDISHFVDEIVIADNGSTDGSVDIAKQAGARVYQIEWKNNYSDAKNYCLDKAEGRWVLFLQPSERISPEQLKKIGPLLDNPNAEGYLLYFDQSPDHHKIISPVQSLRLFRNRKEYRFQYSAFECFPEEVLTNIRDSGIRICQHAEQGSDIGLLALLKEDLDKQPENGYLQYIYGIGLLNQDRNEEGLLYLQSARKKVNLDCYYAPHLYKCLAWSCISLNRYTDAFEVLDEGAGYYPLSADLLVLRGDLRKRLYQYEEAVRDLEASLKIKELSDFRAPVSEISSSFIMESLGEVHEQMLNYRKALDCYQQALKCNRVKHDLLYKIGELAGKAGSAGTMDRWLKEVTERDDFEEMMILTDVLYQQHEYAKVLASLEYLEPHLGKEQTECIRYSCYLMLKEFEKAELSVPIVRRDPLLYRQILLEQIESGWLHDQWLEAERKIEEMDQTEGIETPVKAVYHLIHKAFTEKGPVFILSEQQNLETVNAILEKLLWLGQTGKAKLLMRLLWNGTNDDQLIKLGLHWAKQGELRMLQEIYQHVSDREKQIEFTQNIIAELLCCGHVESAWELAKSTELSVTQSLGALRYVLDSKVTMNRLGKWIRELRRKKPEDGTEQVLSRQKAVTPDESLLSFYHSLGLIQNIVKEADPKKDDGVLSCAGVHSGIGGIYEKAGQKREALSAYLRALKWDPLNEPVQNRITNMAQDDPEQFYAELNKIAWVSEGGWFQNKDEFVPYVHGLVHFKNNRYEPAMESFAEIVGHKGIHSAALAYMTSCLWIEKKQAAAEKLLEEQSSGSEAVLFLFSVCKNRVLEKLSEGRRKYPYSELILLEEQRVKNLLS